MRSACSLPNIAGKGRVLKKFLQRPFQMVHILELRYVASILTCFPQSAVYVKHHHESRAGWEFSGWQGHLPSYALLMRIKICQDPRKAVHVSNCSFWDISLWPTYKDGGRYFIGRQFAGKVKSSS